MNNDNIIEWLVSSQRLNKSQTTRIYDELASITSQGVDMSAFSMHFMQFCGHRLTDQQLGILLYGGAYDWEQKDEIVWILRSRVNDTILNILIDEEYNNWDFFECYKDKLLAGDFQDTLSLNINNATVDFLLKNYKLGEEDLDELFDTYIEYLEGDSDDSGFYGYNLSSSRLLEYLDDQFNPRYLTPYIKEKLEELKVKVSNQVPDPGY